MALGAGVELHLIRLLTRAIIGESIDLLLVGEGGTSDVKLTEATFLSLYSIYTNSINCNYKYHILLYFLS